MAKKTVAAKKRNVKVDAYGQAHIHSSFNNIIVSLANSEGQVISWSSAGKMGFRSSKKNTPYAAQMAAQDCAKVAYDLGLRKVKVFVKGPGNGRESAIRTIHGAGIEVTEIVDVTPLPHNGCRPPKKEKSIINYSFLNIESGIVNRLHIDLILSVIAAARFQIQTEHLKNKKMARYTGPRTRIARKFGEAIFGADKVLSKKNYPPGQHGNSRKRKTSEYGIQLREKQKAKIHLWRIGEAI